MLKRAEKIHAIRTEAYRVSRTQSYFILAFAIAVMVGMVISFLASSITLRIVGSTVMAVGAGGVITLYSILRVRGPLSFVVIDYKTSNGEWVQVQSIGKKSVAISYRGIVLRWHKGEITTGGELFYKGVDWKWYILNEYSNLVEKDRQMVQLSYPSEEEKRFIQLKEGFPYYAEAFSLRLHYLEINSLSKEIFVPKAFISAMRKIGLNEPNFIKSL